MKISINNVADIKSNIAKKLFGDLKKSGVSAWLIDMIREEEFSMIAELKRHHAITDASLFAILSKIIENPSSLLSDIAPEKQGLEILAELETYGDDITDFNTIFLMIKHIKVSPYLAYRNSGIIGDIFVLLANSPRDGTLISTKSNIDLCIAKGHFDYLKANMVSSWVSKILDEDISLTILEQLRSNNIITDSDVYYEAIDVGNHEIDNEEYLELLEKFPRDDSLAIYGDQIWYMTNENSLPLVEWLIKAGVDIDHNKFLIYTFAGDHDDLFELFDLLIENFTDFTQEALMSACQIVLDIIKHGHYPESESEYLRVIITLLKQIDSLDTVFEDGDYYYSLFGAFLEKTPKLLLSLDEISDDYIPSQSALEGIEWRYFVCEADFGEQHLITLKALIARGAQFPLEKIIEALEESEMEEFIAELKAMIK